MESSTPLIRLLRNHQLGTISTSCHCPQLPDLTPFFSLLDGWPKTPLGCFLGSTNEEEGLPAFSLQSLQQPFLSCSEEHPGSDNIPHSFSERQVSKIRNERHVRVGVMGEDIDALFSAHGLVYPAQHLSDPGVYSIVICTCASHSPADQTSQKPSAAGFFAGQWTSRITLEKRRVK